MSRPSEGARTEFVTRSRHPVSESLVDVIRDHLVAGRIGFVPRSSGSIG